MKFINKYLLMSFLVLGSFNIKAREAGEPDAVPAPAAISNAPAPTSSSWCSSINRDNACLAAHILTQIASIHYADTNNAKLVQGLAAARGISNGIIITAGAQGLLGDEHNLRKADIVHGIDVYMRLKYALKDFKAFFNSEKVAALNEGRKENKNLQKKKYCQFAWLAANKLLPYVVNRFDFSKKPLGGLLINPLVLELSEVFRQKMMYALLKNKEKAA